MRPSSALGAALLAAPLLFLAPAAAQPESGLVSSQSLAPASVRLVQQRLREIGVYQGALDGVWGPDSQAALERFQQGRSLRVTGQLNQATVATLGLRPADLLAAGSGAAATGADAAPAAMAAPLSAFAVRNVQARLRAMGFYRGPADGIWGPGTQAAVERFRQGRGLQANGQLNPETAQALGLDPNNLEAPPIRVR
ncbi:peptidoglycan-binding domain-containing protein [Caldovatus aquaticus]|uniref:Peptidoglycan-binding protein n=1 Tax=Caldovatus aquaticus TaxID=2865671 RepID=A0ABS7F374_9PROT|nr:peptidoglycan-binding domain-containing protein [Caldovatus aquaticus]MBW8269944.1 peptidoglycan-binding protein [Caldovatus aquaticus]